MKKSVICMLCAGWVSAADALVVENDTQDALRIIVRIEPEAPKKSTVLLLEHASRGQKTSQTPGVFTAPKGLAHLEMNDSKKNYINESKETFAFKMSVEGYTADRKKDYTCHNLPSIKAQTNIDQFNNARIRLSENNQCTVENPW